MLLAIETSSLACSVALETPQGVVSRTLYEPRVHAKALVALVHEVLDESKATLNDIQGCVIGDGPGSFTGIRIGCGFVQGLALGLNIPVYKVSSLKALAWNVFQQTGANHILVLQDARMQEIYSFAARFEEHQAEVFLPDALHPVGKLPKAPFERDYVIVGDALCTYPELKAQYAAKILTTTFYPTADALLAVRSDEPALNATQAWPSYLRGESGWKPAGA